MFARNTWRKLFQSGVTWALNRNADHLATIATELMRLNSNLERFHSQEAELASVAASSSDTPPISDRPESGAGPSPS